jgi:importin subunit beta-1
VLLGACMQTIIDFEEHVYSDRENWDESVIRTAVALLGDMGSTIQGIGPLLAQRPFVKEFLQECQQSTDPQLVDTANWAAGTLSKALVGA